MTSLNKKEVDAKYVLDNSIKKKYDVLKRLGKGAYGIVWKISDKNTKETKAIKKIFDAFRDPTDAKRTFREVTILRAFNSHPNIIRMLDVHRALNDQDIYLTFEYMQSDLNNVIRLGTILKDVHKRYIMYQLLNAVKYIHSYSIVHRDLKPSNILIDTKCRCKIGDFGLARALPTQISNNVVVINKIKQKVLTDPPLTDYVATRWYRAPELLASSRMYSKGVDMWSLGCILGEMFSGKPIFQGTNTAHQIELIVNCAPNITDDDISAVISGLGYIVINLDPNRKRKTLSELVPNISPEALELMSALLVFNPRQRITANDAIGHSYLEQYRNMGHELKPNKSIVLPVREDILLTVPEYRSQLYEYAEIQPDARVFIRQKNAAMKKNSTEPHQRALEIRRAKSDLHLKTQKSNKTEKVDPQIIVQKEKDWNLNEKMALVPKPGSYIPVRKEYKMKQSQNGTLSSSDSVMIMTKDGAKMERITVSKNPLMYKYIDKTANINSASIKSSIPLKKISKIIPKPAYNNNNEKLKVDEALQRPSDINKLVDEKPKDSNERTKTQRDANLQKLIEKFEDRDYKVFNRSSSNGANKNAEVVVNQPHGIQEIKSIEYKPYRINNGVDMKNHMGKSAPKIPTNQANEAVSKHLKHEKKSEVIESTHYVQRHKQYLEPNVGLEPKLRRDPTVKRPIKNYANIQAKVQTQHRIVHRDRQYFEPNVGPRAKIDSDLESKIQCNPEVHKNMKNDRKSSLDMEYLSTNVDPREKNVNFCEQTVKQTERINKFYGPKIQQLEDQIKKYQSDVVTYVHTKDERSSAINNDHSFKSDANRDNSRMSEENAMHISGTHHRKLKCSDTKINGNLNNLYMRTPNTQKVKVADEGGGDFIRVRSNATNIEGTRFQHKHEFRSYEHNKK